MMYKRILLIFLISYSVGHISAQQPLRTSNITTSTTNTGKGIFYPATSPKYRAPRAIVFDEPTVTGADFLANVNGYFKIPTEFSFVETESNTDNLGMQHHLMQQYYKGIPMEGLTYRVHEKNGFVTSANGKAMRAINLDDINTIISEEQAFDLAVKYLQTKDTVFRSGKKLIVSKNFTFAPEGFSVAFQFDIDVSFIERWRVSIDARTGELINKVSLVYSCMEPLPPSYDTGIGRTNYYGTKTIRVKKNDNGSSKLFGQTEHGGLIETYDFRNASVLGLIFGFYEVYPFSDGDNNYLNSYQRPAVSVHWATEQAYEYYYNRHNRNSFNNNGATIKSYVHVGQGYNNAMWTRGVLAFGDGSNNNPLVELDIVSHELTHGVTQYEAGLMYSYEPGALNESFSDILGKAVEFNTFGAAATWQIGRYFESGGLRDMSNPKIKDQPNTYLGDLWYTGGEDSGGVHYNSGVQNFWFYLLCEGGSGVNDRGVSYSVASIGMDTAVNIVYRNLTEYLISSSDYLDSRIGSLLATTDLYGKNSAAYQQVDKAWDAVGVINEPIITSLNLYDITATTVKLNGSFLPRGDSVNYHFEYGTTPEFGSSTSNYDYTGTVEGIITGLQPDTRYYVRLVATNENGKSSTACEFTTLPLKPLVKIKNTVDVTETSATLYGQVNPNSLPTSFYFEYGPTPDMGLVSSSYSLPDTTEFLKVSALVTDLQPRQTYYYKLIATNSYTTTATDSLAFFTSVKPIISGFSPVTAIQGTEVTITGQGFNETPEMNLVNFGAVRGEVVSSSLTEIKVKVPKGASFGSISLLDAQSGRAAECTQEFVPTYIGEFDKSDLSFRAGFDDYAIYQMAIQDMDGDNRPDIVASNYYGVTIFQNINTGGDIDSMSFVQTTIPITSFSFRSLVDLDGNGFKDIVGIYENKIRIYPNYSVPGYLFFGLPVDLSIEKRPTKIQFKDFDNDGYIDIAGTQYLEDNSTVFTIFRNQSPKGALSSNSFVQQYSKTISSGVYSFTPTDINNDGLPDLIAPTYSTGSFSILKNSSFVGAFEFEEKIIPDSLTGRYGKYAVHDLNRDGWKDVAFIPDYQPENTNIYQHEGEDISLLSPIVLLDNLPIRSITPGDFDGDGKVDLVLGDDDGRFFVLKNDTESEEVLSDSSFVELAHYGTNDNNRDVRSEVMLHDLNGDGRPEVINARGYSFYPYIGYQLEIWQNSPNDCPDPHLIDVNVSRNSATIVLPSNTTLKDFEIEYASAGYTNWRQVSSTTIYYLSLGASYQLRARTKCYLGYTSYYYIDFTTECMDLTSFSISNIQIDDVSLSAYNLSSIEVQYSEAGKDQWVAVSRYTDHISDLLPGTTYDLRYRGRCDTPAPFHYIQFTTLCPTLSTLVIDDITFNKAVVNWTSNYAGEAILEYTADNITWTMIDETQRMFPLIPGTQYVVRGRLACTDTNSSFTSTSFFTPCPTVSMLTVDRITPFSAEINWEDESGTGSYTITYETAAGEMKTTVANSTSFFLEDLTPGTQYTVYVAPECISTKDFAATTFTTVCYTPFNLSADAVTHTTAELSWDDNFNGFPYTIDYSIVGSDVWLTTESASTTVTLKALRPGTRYVARAHINCSSVAAHDAAVLFETSLYGKTMIAPNPTENTITIYPSKNLIGNSFGIYDNTGRRVAGGKLLDYTFELSAFPAGIYMLRIEGEKLFRVVKE